MSTGFLEKIKGFLFDPTDTLIRHKNENLSDALWYYIVFLAIYGILFGLVVGLGFGTMGGALGGGRAFIGGAILGGALGIIGVVLALIIAGLIGLFLWGIIVHIFVLIVGGRRGLSTTVRALIYAMTPNLLLGWIPVVGILAALWSLVLEVLAIRELHEISTTRAIFAVIVVPILFMILAAIVAVFVFGMAGY